MASAAAGKKMDVDSDSDSDDENGQIVYQDDTLKIEIKRNSYGPIFFLTFNFTKEIHGFRGYVVTNVWNYEGRPESDKIELALVKITKKDQGKGLCKPMVMYCMKKTIQFYIQTKRRIPNFVQIDVVSKTPERAVDCYVSVLSSLGLIQMQSEKEKDETYWIDHYIDYSFPEDWNPSWLREEILLLHETDRYFKLDLENPPSLKEELSGAAAAKQGGRRRRRKTKKRKKRKTKRRKRKKRKRKTKRRR